MSELNDLKKRITHLEIAVGRLDQLVAVLREGIFLAAGAPVKCGKCGESLDGPCADPECPSGLFKGELE
jgi:hypothetical protein